MNPINKKRGFARRILMLPFIIENNETVIDTKDNMTKIVIMTCCCIIEIITYLPVQLVAMGRKKPAVVNILATK